MSLTRVTRTQAGAATVDFVLVLLVLLPLFMGVLQLALVLHVRNTASAAVGEGARLAATQGAGPHAGVARVHDQLEGVVSDRFTGEVRVETVSLDGMPAYRLLMDVSVPTLGLGGPAVSFTVSGHAVLEPALTADAGDPL